MSRIFLPYIVPSESHQIFYIYQKKHLHLFPQQYNMHNALGVVAQLVRASACHAEGRGFEPRQSRQCLRIRQNAFFYLDKLDILVFFLVYYL